jgi:hypothetical protein
MSEKHLFELPDIRITTEKIVFFDATLAVNDIASMEIDDRRTGWSECILLVAVFAMAYLLTYVVPHQGFFWYVTFFLVGYLSYKLSKWLPHVFVLKIKMKDKMFYEVITRTNEEAEIIQKHINEAMTRKNATEIPAVPNPLLLTPHVQPLY